MLLLFAIATTVVSFIALRKHIKSDAWIGWSQPLRLSVCGAWLIVAVSLVIAWSYSITGEEIHRVFAPAFALTVAGAFCAFFAAWRIKSTGTLRPELD